MNGSNAPVRAISGWPEMALVSALRANGDRLLAVAFTLFVTISLAGIVSADTAASFSAQTVNPSNTLRSLSVQPPASQNAATSAAAGIVNLSWTATPTVPGAGHTLTYLVLRGPVGGPYAQIGSTTSLAFSDTPPADGSYGYVVRAQVTGGGSFTSGDSTARSGVSDRIAPAMSISCNGAACSASWYTAAVSVTVSGTDAGTGMGSVTRSVDGGAQTSTGGASATFSVSGDSAGHTVQYYGTDAAGNASGTTTQTIKIDGTAPTVPTGVSSASGTGAGTTVDLTWIAGTDATSGVAGYTVRWVQANTCPAASPANYPGSATVGAVTAYTIGGLNPGSKYCAYVTTTDAAGNVSAASAVTGPTMAR